MSVLHSIWVRDASIGDEIRAGLWRIQAYGLLIITFLSFFPRFFRLGEHLFFALLAVAVLLCWAEGRRIWVRTPMDLPLLLFVGWVLFTVPFAVDPGYSFSEWRKLASQVLLFYWALLVLRRASNSTAPAADPRIVSESSLVQGLLIAVVLGSTLMSAWALIDFLERGGTWRDRIIRAHAPGSDYNWLATYAVTVLPVVLFVTLKGTEGWRRIAGSLSAILTFLALIFSYTRAGWIALIIQVMVFAVLNTNRRLTFAVLGVVGGVASLLVALAYLGYQRQTVDPVNLDYRLAGWEYGIQTILAHPLVGVGYGNDTFIKVLGGLTDSIRVWHLHSTWLMIAFGSGVPAILLIGWAMVRLLRGLARSIHSAERSLDVGTAVLIAAVGFIVRNLFDYMFAGSLAYLFWILVGVALVSPTLRRRPSAA